MEKSIVLRAPRSRAWRAITNASRRNYFLRPSRAIVLAAILVWFGTSSAQASTVYVLRGGDVTSDAAVVGALTAGGHVVTSGVETIDWDGTQANLSEYDVVIVLNNFNWSDTIPVPGRRALIDYVSGGGAIVVSEWLNWNVSCSSSYPELDVLLPVTCVDFNYETSTTYSQVQPDPIMDEGLPSSFSFSLREISGTESSLDPKQGAAVFFSSSNGGGRPNSVGVAGWDVLGGRVISYSTLVTDTELASAEYRILLGIAANWARVADLAVTNSAVPDPVPSGAPITYTITASNNGPSTALAVTLTDPLSEHTTFQSLVSPPGWSCDTPSIGGSGTVTCTKPSVGAGEQGAFTLVANVNVDVPEGTRIDNTATIRGSTFDPNPNNNAATATVTVLAP